MMIGSTAKLLLGALLAASASAVHYEKPPCGSDEKAVQLMGIDGVFCSPQCSPDCPSDVPAGVTASPTCALQSPDGAKYCAILCTPSRGRYPGNAHGSKILGGGECGSDMDCMPIPQSGGFGVCVYPLSLGVSPEAHVVFGITE